MQRPSSNLGRPHYIMTIDPIIKKPDEILPLSQSENNPADQRPQYLSLQIYPYHKGVPMRKKRLVISFLILFPPTRWSGL